MKKFQIEKDFENKRFNEQYEICHFVAPNKEYMPNAVWAKNKKFVSIYYEIGTSNNKSDKFLSKSGYNRCLEWKAVRTFILLQSLNH